MAEIYLYIQTKPKTVLSISTEGGKCLREERRPYDIE